MPLPTWTAAVFVLLSAGKSGAATEASRNVLLIIADDLTANALGCYGNTQCKTPNIDRLAARGTRFSRAYCQYPVCGPSRAALMSGMYAQAVGVTGNGGSGKFAKNMGERPSLAEHFKNHGWTTARVSKIYHMRVPGDITAGGDGPDHPASWTMKFNCRGPEWMTEGLAEHLSQERLKWEPYKHYGLGFGSAFYAVRGNGDGSEQPDAKAATHAVRLLSELQDRPFFLAVGLVRPHVPLVAPEPYFEPYRFETMHLAPRVEDDWSDIPAAGITHNSKQARLDGQPDKQRKVLTAYYAAVSFMDAQVGRILDQLARLGLEANTLVVFKSDHGYHLGEHDLWQKMSLHEESARIPLIVATPDAKAAVSDSLVEAIDMYPTLAEWAGLDVPGHCQGKSLMPVLADPTHSVRDLAYCMSRKANHLVRTERWAYIDYPEGAELYDMQSDPLQFTNLVDSETPAHQQALAMLRERLAAKLAAMGDAPSESE